MAIIERLSKYKNTIGVLSISLILLVFIACKKKKTKSAEEETVFDKSAMLTNYADNLIVPNLQNFKMSLDSLEVSFQNFVQAKTTVNLNDAREKYRIAYIRFQHIASFEFGPSESELVRANFNTYPCNSAQINSNIALGNYNLGTLNNLDAKGFPAIDFLLYGNNETDAEIVALFDTEAKGSNRVSYINACLSDMQLKTNNIVNAWMSSYRNTFISSTGAQIGSSLGLLINQLNFEIDLLKNAKLGIPLGKKSLGTALPEKCEAYYSNTLSVMLAKECLLAIENNYLGRSASGIDSKGLDDYLEAIKSQRGSETLNNAIKNQFALAKSKLNTLPEPLSASVINATTTVDAAYLEIVKLLVLLKTDVPSALGVIITYQDGDGD
jgi:uncharacterized protein